jgi:hypothetical protein
VEAHSSQDTLYVAARFLGEPPLRTLVVLEPAPAAGQGSRPYRAGLPFIGLDSRSTFTTSPGGHLMLSEPWAGRLRWVPDVSLPEGIAKSLLVGGGDMFLDRVASCALKGPEVAVRHEAATPAVNVPRPGPSQPEAKAKADRAYQELMDQEKVQEGVNSRAQAKRARKKACKQRRRGREAQAKAVAAPEPVAALPAPQPAPRADPAGPRPHSAPPVLEPAAAAASKPKGGNPMVLQESFLLGEEAVRRAAGWMVEHAGRANPPRELAAWRLAGSVGEPRFSFGCYQRPDPDLRVLLQIRYLWAYARAIDRVGKDLPDALLGGELAAAQGITGRLDLEDGSSLVTYGLEVIQGPGGEVLAIRPGGATSGE